MDKIIEFFIVIILLAILIQYWWVLLLAVGIFLLVKSIIGFKKKKTKKVHDQESDTNTVTPMTIKEESSPDKRINVVEVKKEKTTPENIEPHSLYSDKPDNKDVTDKLSFYKDPISAEKNDYTNKIESTPSPHVHKLRRKLTDFVVFDIETTGLNKFEDKIIQISAIKYVKDKKVATFNEYINPGFHIDKKIMFLTGISNDTLESSPTLSTVMPSFELFIADFPLVGHNIIRFDIPFLINNGISKKDISALDTYPLSDRKLPDLKNHKLPTLKKYFGIINRSHNALNDCETNAIVYQHLRDDKLDPVTIERSNTQQFFSGKRFCVTGEFMETSREDLVDVINEYGGKYTHSVSRLTDYLIDGTQVSGNLTDGVHSSSELKAMQFQKENGRIQIISYKDFCELLSSKNYEDNNIHSQNM